MDAEDLGDLCDKFLYDHESAMEDTRKLASSSGQQLTIQEVKDFISEMHKTGDFDDVICFSAPLYNNDLYKKFHPDELSTSSK